MAALVLAIGLAVGPARPVATSTAAVDAGADRSGVARGAVPAALASYERAMTDLMAAWSLPGGSLAVMKDGKLVMAAGFGVADAETGTAPEPDSLFRVASLSKVITGVAVLKLVEEGRLDLDGSAFARLGDLTPPPGATVDPRIGSVTVRHLLQHTGGWDRDEAFDPMFRSAQISQAMGTPAPASCETTIRYMLGRPLDFDPGARFAYSNFGYCVLGRLIERATGQPYEAYVRANVLAPMGITRAAVGHTRPEERLPGEVRYHDYPGAPRATSVLPGAGRVPFPYGGWYHEAHDANGAWVISAVDLMRFVAAVDGLGGRPPFLQPSTRALLTGTYSPVWRPNSRTWRHFGSLRGNRALLQWQSDGVAFAALFNSRPQRDADFTRAFGDALAQATRDVAEWPAGEPLP